LTRNYTDNYDYHLFKRLSFKQRIKESVKGTLHKNGFYRIDLDMLNRFLNNSTIENFEYLYAIPNDPESKDLIMRIILYDFDKLN
jgi:hypothetical protein